MECPACQTELPIEAKFCNVCGEKLEIDCPECNKSNPLGSRFCLVCGHKLAAGPPIEKAKAIADAERKQVTALFSDLSGYTAMTERLDPEEVKEITGNIFHGVRTIVSKYDGFIERFAGDGVLALFGVPKSHEDDALRAVRAAREIHELVESMNPQYEAKVGAHLSMHSGINTGLAVTADVDPEKGTHGVTGDSINVAARLSDLAKAGDILVGPSTYRQAERHFALKALEPIKLKGKSEPISVYKVLSLKEEPITVHRKSGLRASLIGRKAELSQLQEAVERLKGGASSVIDICGDAGTGKSRLVEEFKSSLDLSKIRWREGHSYPYAQNIPYFPLMDLMNRAWRIEEGDPPDKIREKIESGVERLLGTREEVAPYVGSLYSLSYPEIEEVSPEFWKPRLFEGIKSVVAALTQYAPTVFCFEDIHWSDPSTLDLLRFLLSDLEYPALFICVHRLPFSLFSAHQMGALGVPYEEIHLTDLSPSDTLDMVESLLSADSIPGDLRKFIQKKVEGNPFYVEEAINSLVESETLIRDNGSWKLSRPLNEADIPQTVQGVISARLDRLEREMKRILQEASVIGRAFLHEILKRITALQDSLDQSLRNLEMLDLVRVRSLKPDLEYIFKHALTQEVVYNGLLKKERQGIHEQIGLVIEQLFRDRLSEFYETLAFHFQRGRSVIKAMDYLIKAGEKSQERYALKESHQYFSEAFELVSKEQSKIGEKGLLIDLLLKWAHVYHLRGAYRGLIQLLAPYEQMVQSLNDNLRLGMFYCWLGTGLRFRERLADSHQYLIQALRIGEELQDPRLIGHACCCLAGTCTEFGFLEEAVAYGKRAQEIAHFFQKDPEILRSSLASRGLAYAFGGNRKKVEEVGTTLLHLGETKADPRSSTIGHLMIGWSHLVAGDLTSAIECCKTAARTAREPTFCYDARVILGYSYVMNSQYEEAAKNLEELMEVIAASGCEIVGTCAKGLQGIVITVQGNPSKGLSIVEDVLATYGSQGSKFRCANIHCFLGKVYLQMVQGAGPKDLSFLVKNIGFLIKSIPFATKKAESHFMKAIELAKEIRAKSILGQAYLDLGLLQKTRKRKDEARECITKAIELFEQCEAETFLKQAREELRSIG